MNGPAGADPRRLDAVVRGQVQGVGFRWFVVLEAERLGLTGWVANEPGGTVHCVAEGPEDELRLFLAALREGPRAARVDSVDERWGPATGAFGDFGVRYGWSSGD